MFRQNRLKLALSVALVSGSMNLTAPAMAESKHHDDEHRQHGKHEHGVANMTIALDGKQLLVELDSPAMNILGFEHNAETPEHKAVAADMWKRLQHPDGVIRLEGGDCTVASSSIQMPQFDQANAEDQHSDHESDHGEPKVARHSDINASYEFVCAKPDQLESMQVELFQTFPNFEEVEAQWIINGRQCSRHLTAGESAFAVK